MSDRLTSGTERCWDNEKCPRDDCEGELQQQDQFNVMCLSCEGIWSHVKTETKHYLQTVNFQTVAEKPVVMTDGGTKQKRVSSVLVDCRDCGDGIEVTVRTFDLAIDVGPGWFLCNDCDVHAATDGGPDDE